jgi:hypothetical protein
MPRSKDPNHGKSITWEESFDQVTWYARTGKINATGRKAGWYYVQHDAILFEDSWAFSGLSWVWNDVSRRNVEVQN